MPELGYAPEALRQQAHFSPELLVLAVPSPGADFSQAELLGAPSFSATIVPTSSALLNEPNLHRRETKPKPKPYGNRPTSWVASAQL